MGEGAWGVTEMDGKLSYGKADQDSNKEQLLSKEVWDKWHALMFSHKPNYVHKIYK